MPGSFAAGHDESKDPYSLKPSLDDDRHPPSAAKAEWSTRRIGTAEAVPFQGRLKAS
jgi:hypothetical protein